MTLALPELDVLGDRTIIRVVDLEAFRRSNLPSSKHTSRDADTHACATIRSGEERGGETGIRTLGTLARTTVFETVPFDRSGTSPIPN